MSVTEKAQGQKGSQFFSHRETKRRKGKKTIRKSGVYVRKRENDAEE